jgi:hypothetical protein
MGLRNLLRRLTGSGEREEKEPDTREDRSLFDSSEHGQERFGPQPKPTGQEKPKH